MHRPALKRFAGDRRGVSAIEFAFIAPVLIMVYFSIAELSLAMLAQLKVSHAASAVGDLVTQASTVDPGQLTDVYDASSSIIQPFPSTTMAVCVMSVTANAAGVPSIDWHNAQNMTCPTTPTLPTGLLGASQSIVVSEVKYTYTSPMSYLFKAPIKFDQTFYLRPRQSAQVTCPTC